MMSDEVLLDFCRALVSTVRSGLTLSDAFETLAGSWYKILLVGSLSILALRWLLRSAPGRKARGIAGHWLPLYRFATIEGRFYYIYTTIGLLLKAGLPLTAMTEVLVQFSQDDLITRRRLRRASELLSSGVGFSESVAPLMQEDDRHAMEIAEKAGRLDDTMLARAKLHYDRHLHRMKILVTWFNISTMIAIALVCFALILTVAWPAISVMRGTKDPLRTLGLSTPGEGGGQALPANSGGARRKKAAPLSPGALKTKLFNEKYCQKAMEFMQQYGKAPGKASGGGQTETPAPKKLVPVSSTGKLQFRKAEQTSIQPSTIKGH